MQNLHTFDDKEHASDFHPDVAKMSYDGVSVEQLNQISETQDTESYGRSLSDEAILNSMKTESDEQHLTGEVEVEISEDTLKCVFVR